MTTHSLTRGDAIEPGTILEWFRTLPGVRAIVQRAQDELTKETHAERLQVLADQARLRTEDAAARVAYDRRVAPLAASIADLERTLTAKREELGRVHLDFHAAQLRRGQALDRCESRLYVSRPRDAIEAFCAELTTIAEGLRLQYDEVRTGGQNGKLYCRWHNGDSIGACHAVLADLRTVARGLWREALTDDELQSRFEAMRQQIPPLDSRPANVEQLSTVLAGR